MSLQGELLAPDPPRTIRAAGDACWLGVDPSTLRVSIAWTGPRGRGVLTRSFPRLRDGARLDAIYTETSDLVLEVMERCGPVGFVLVEDPFGQNVNHVSYHAAGVVMLALCQVTGAVTESIPVPRWKKTALGYGAAKKDQILRWARANGYDGLLQDEADAWGVAEAARRLVGFSECVLSAG